MELHEDGSDYSTMISEISRNSDDEMDGPIISTSDDPLTEYPAFTCASDILAAEELWIWDLLSQFSNTERLITTMDAAGMKIGRGKLSKKMKTKCVELLVDQDFIEAFEEEFQDESISLHQLVEVANKVFKRILSFSEGKVSGQAGDPSSVLTAWDHDVLQLLHYYQEQAAECRNVKPDTGKERKRKLVPEQAQLTNEEKSLLNECPPNTNDPDISRRTKNREDMVRRREERDLAELRGYTGSLKVTSQYLSRETFLQYPELDTPFFACYSNSYPMCGYKHRISMCIHRLRMHWIVARMPIGS